MATEFYETRHCGRVIISSAWNFCPFCGSCLHCESNLASEPRENSPERLKAFCCDAPLDRNLRAAPITGDASRIKRRTSLASVGEEAEK